MSRWVWIGIVVVLAGALGACTQPGAEDDEAQETPQEETAGEYEEAEGAPDEPADDEATGDEGTPGEDGEEGLAEPLGAQEPPGSAGDDDVAQDDEEDDEEVVQCCPPGGGDPSGHVVFGAPPSPPYPPPPHTWSVELWHDRDASPTNSPNPITVQNECHDMTYTVGGAAPGDWRDDIVPTAIGPNWDFVTMFAPGGTSAGANPHLNPNQAPTFPNYGWFVHDQWFVDWSEEAEETKMGGCFVVVAEYEDQSSGTIYRSFSPRVGVFHSMDPAHQPPATYFVTNLSACFYPAQNIPNNGVWLASSTMPNCRSIISDVLP